MTVSSLRTTRRYWPTRRRWKLLTMVGGLVAVVGMWLPHSAHANPIGFISTVIDYTISGDCKMVGDIDGDGFNDVLVGGQPGENLNWYHYPDWLRTRIAIPDTEFTTDGELGDVDGDGDLDVVVPDGPNGDNLLWFENPRPGGDPFAGSQWTRHVIGAITDWGKDVEPADYDHDGRLDVATRTHTHAYVFFQSGPGVWSRVMVIGGLDGEGMASGDIDGDGDTDLVLRGFWLENPAPVGDPTAGNWPTHDIFPGLYPDLKALVIDLNQNGVMDVLYSDSEATGDVLWCEPANGDPRGTWNTNVIVPMLERCHTLQAADMDLDGDLDVVLGQMHTSQNAELFVYYNLDGSATNWSVQVVDNTGLHNGVVTDIGNDGDFDIFGCNWTGNPPVRLWENQVAHCPNSDINHDQIVDIDDLSLLLAACGTSAGQPDFNPDADLNQDGTVDLPDIAILQREYGDSCGP